MIQGATHARIIKITSSVRLLVDMGQAGNRITETFTNGQMKTAKLQWSVQSVAVEIMDPRISNNQITKEKIAHLFRFD